MAAMRQGAVPMSRNPRIACMAVMHGIEQFDRSGRRYPLRDPRWRGDDGSPLMIDPIPGLGPGDIDVRERSLWRYGTALPVDATARVGLGEGWTPLIPRPWAGHDVRFKLEWFNPTSSFKDRGASVMLAHLRSLGATAVLEDSSGNGGAAIAAYAAAAGLAAKILVPAATSPAKILQARAFGAEIELVDGTRDDVADEAIRQAGRAGIAYASHNWHPMFLQGVKTVAYELWEQLGFRAPDNVVLVAGAGSNVLGCDIGFGELLRAGSIDRLPRLLVAQPEHWAAIVEALAAEDASADRVGGRPPTIAEGASIARPVRLPEAVAAVRRSGGAGVAVSDEEIRGALGALAREGLYAEPTSAVAVAALDRFIADGTIRAGETTAVILTGSGLKSAEQMALALDAG